LFGKTTTCRLTHAALNDPHHTVCPRDSFNNHIGVPLTILNAPAHCRTIICELGTSSPGEIAFLSNLIQPDIAAITSIGCAHAQGLAGIKNAVRAPGERAKVAVFSRERDVDPVGACVGMKGSRVQSIIRELRGEKIDIIEFSDDLVTFAQSALAPAKITRVSVTHHGVVPHLDVIVEDEQLSLAIGKRGQNVRLASELISCRIDIKSETDVKDEVADALAKMLQDAMAESDPPPEAAEESQLDWSLVPEVSEEAAAGLRAAGFTSLDAVLGAEAEALEAVEGVDSETARNILIWATADPEEDVEESALDGSLALDNDDFMTALSNALKESELTTSPIAADDEPPVATEGDA